MKILLFTFINLRKFSTNLDTNEHRFFVYVP